jgi:hypothetical protein
MNEIRLILSKLLINYGRLDTNRAQLHPLNEDAFRFSAHNNHELSHDAGHLRFLMSLKGNPVCEFSMNQRRGRRKGDA